MRDFFAVSKGKVGLTVGAFLVLLLAALVSERVFSNVNLAGWLFFPLRLYLGIYPLLRHPGYDDIQYGSQLFPGSELVAILVTIVISVLLVYIAVCLGVSMVQGRGRRQKAE